MNGHSHLVLVCIGLLLPGLAAAERRDHDAHVHGTAAMDVAVLGGEVEIALRSPAMNIVGFEHASRTEEQEHSLQEAIETLRDGTALFDFGDAGCRLGEADVHHQYAGAGDESESGHEHGEAEGEHAEHEHDEHGHDEGGQADHDEHNDASHSEIRAHYRFECGDNPPVIDVTLFERFPLTENIRVQYLTDSSQGAQTLTPDEPVLRLE